MTRAEFPGLRTGESTLQVYLLGTIEFEAALRLQRRLQSDVADNRASAALVLCEHPVSISVGRHGSHAHIRGEFQPRECPTYWVCRGGGCVLHLPGQLAVYPIFPLDRLELDVASYMARLRQTMVDLTADFSLRAPTSAQESGVFVGGRLLAVMGVSVHDWVSSFGVYLNVQPSLDLFRYVQCLPEATEPMTSMERERRGPVRPSMVRQRLIEHFQAQFGFDAVALFSDHPALVSAHPSGRAPNNHRRRVAARHSQL